MPRKISGGTGTGTVPSFPTVNYAPKSTIGGMRAVTKGGRFVAPAESVGPMTLITMLLLVVVLCLISYILYLIYQQQQDPATRSIIPSLGAISTRNSGGGDPFRDPYAPPLRNDGVYFPRDSGDIRGLPIPSHAVPINTHTRGFQPEFTQIGILVYERSSSSSSSSKETPGSTATSEMLSNSTIRDNLILPLMGRRVMNGRDKYQYYTVSNTGSLNTKLPIKVRGRNCINEYGCDEIMSGDVVYVEGYNHPFRTTVYENSTFSYIPVL